MNRIYRLVWNRALRAFRVASELARGRTRDHGGRRALRRLALLGLLPLPALAGTAPGALPAHALPTGGQVTAGAGRIAQGGSTLTVTQQSQHLSLSWQSFDIGRGASVDFLQPNASAIAVNRVRGTDASRIFGHLNANGQVFLINPNGILFGKGAQVNVGGLVASTLDLDDGSLGSGTLTFRGDSKAGVTNLGTLSVRSGGYAALLGHRVSNQGAIHATLGSVALAGGNAVTLSFDGDALVGVAVQKSQLGALAENGRLIEADGGQVWMTAGARDSLLASAVNNSGTVEARTVQNRGGTITLLGGMAAGTVNVGGTLDASAPDGGDGGFVETSAASVNMADGHRVTTLASNGKAGTWLIDPTDFTIAPAGGNETGAQLGADLENTDVSLFNSQGNINIEDDVTWGSSHTLSLSGPSTVNIDNAVNAPNGNLAISVTANINEGPGGSLVIGGTSDFTASGSVSLGSANNSFNVIRTLNVPYGSLVLTTSNTLSLPLTKVGGDFTLTTNGPVTATDGVTVGGTFDLLSGNWVQNAASLPSFSAGDFRIESGASFLRAAGGDGSAANPYRIADVYGLQGIASTTLLGDAFVLANDIDASGTANWNASGAGTHAGFRPIGDSSTPFTGSLDGQGHAIDGLVIDRPGTSFVGLFGYVDAGSIRNVDLADASVSGSTYVGALAGYNNAASISDSSAGGNVSGGSDVTNVIYVGGLVGANNTGSISDSYATANVSNNATYGYYFGGLVGGNLAGQISGSWASGTVGGYFMAGGLAGYNGGSIGNSYASGYVNGIWYAGGLVGANDGSIVNSYSSGGIRVGWTGVTGGGLVGTNNGSLSNSFWNSDALANGTYSGSSTGATGKSLAELKQLSTFTAAGWDIDDEGGTGKTWRIYDGNTTPLLRSFMKPLTVGATPDYDGSGTALANIGSATVTYDASADASHVLGTLSGGNTLTLASTAAGAYTATSNASLLGVYSDQLGYDISYGPVTRTIGTPGSAAGDIELPGNVTWTSGTLAINTSGNVVTGSSGINTTAISGDVFRLAQGNWTQDAASPPAFSVVDFGIGSGREAPNATFLRVLGGDGSVGNPYQIADVYGLQGLNSHSLLGDAFALANDIDASGTARWNAGYNADGSAAGFIPIGNDGPRFTGSLDGQYHVIGGLTIHLPGDSWVGLFGKTSTATVQKLGLENVSFSGYDDVGGVIGESQGASVSEVYVTGSLSGYEAIGGIVGENQGGRLDNVYSSASVTDSFDYAGGLVGVNGGSLDHGYFDGIVSGQNNGALVSYNADASGGVVSNSFWNTDTSGFSGVASSDTLAGLTTLFGGSYENTAQMQQLATFTGAGWNISDVGGDGSVWRIYDGGSSPLLRGFLTAATVTVDGSQGSKTYDGHVASGQAAGYTATLANGNAADAGLLLGTLDYATTSANAGSYTLANGKLGLSGLYSGQRGYDISYAGTASYAIGKASLAVTANDAGKTYDRVAYSGGNGVTYQGFVNGETSAVLNGTLVYGGDSQGAVNAGTYTITASGLSSGNYAITYANGTLSVAQRALQGTITASDKVYDGTATAATSGTLLGVIAGDTVGFDTSGAFADKNVGVGKTVTVSGSLSGTDAGNYTLTDNATTTASITPKAISGTIAASNKVYDGTTTATTSGTLLGVVAGDTVGFDTTGRFADKNVGAGKNVAVSGSLSGADAGNYTLTDNATTTASITPKVLDGTITANDKVYDGTTIATTSGTLLGVIAGDTVAFDTSGAFTDKNAGTGKTVTVNGSLSGAGAGNYTLTDNATTTASITPKAINGTITASNKAYDGTTAATTSGALLGVIAGDTVGFDTSGAFADKNVGVGKTVTVSGSLSGTDAGNYTLTDNATTSADITPKVLSGTITADDKVYDGTTAATTSGSLLGVVTGDTVGFDTTGSFADKNAGTGKTVNVNGSLSGADAGNYTLVDNATTTADITPKALDGTITADGKVYDGTTAAATHGILAGLIAGDTVAFDTTGAFADKNAGIGKTVNVNGSLSGTDAGNYTLVDNATTTADITPKALNGTITANDKVYDGTTIATTHGVLAGLIAGDTVNLDTTGNFADKNVGTGKTVSVSGLLSGADAGNYTLVDNSTATADITPKALSGTITAGNKVYDGTTTATTSGSLLGVITGDTVGFNTTGSFADKNVGTGKTVSVNGSLSGVDASNYTLVDNSTTTADITPKTLSGTITADNKVYDGTTVATTSGSLLGVITGDTVGFDISGAFADKNAGTGKTVNVSGSLSGVDAGNYTLVDNSTTTADITPKPLSGTITANNKVYDGTTDATTSGSLLGVVAGDTVGFDTSGAFADKNVGTGKTVAVDGSLSGADAGNYTLVDNTTATADITPKALNGTITADDKVYDGTTAATTHGSLLGLVAGDTVDFDTSGAFADKNAGTGKTVDVDGSLSGADAGNYTLVDNTTATADITPATLTYVATPVQWQVGSPMPALGGDVTGFVGGDTLADATAGTTVFTTTATAQSGAGTYAIDGGGLVAIDGNYVFRQAPANAAAMSVTGGSPVAPSPQPALPVLAYLQSQLGRPAPVVGLLATVSAPGAGTASGTPPSAQYDNAGIATDPYAPDVRVIDGGVRLP